MFSMAINNQSEVDYHDYEMCVRYIEEYFSHRDGLVPQILIFAMLMPSVIRGFVFRSYSKHLPLSVLMSGSWRS